MKEYAPVIAAALLMSSATAEAGEQAGPAEQVGQCLEGPITCAGKAIDQIGNAAVDAVLKPLKDAIEEENETTERRLELQKREREQHEKE